MENTGEVIAASKRHVDGEYIPKQDRSTSMDLRKLINSSFLERTTPSALPEPTKIETKKSKSEDSKEDR